MSKKRSYFGTQVVSDAKRSHKKSGYLRLPEGIKKFDIEEDLRKIQLDFLPYEVTSDRHPDRDADEKRAIPGALWYKLPFKTHRGVGADSSTVVCLKSIGKKCPICEAVEARLKKGVDWDDVKEIASKDRNLYVVVPLGSKKYDEEPHIWDMSQFLFQDLLNDTLKEEEENGIFPDLEEGKTLELKFRWKKFGKRKFPEVTDISFYDREPYKEKILGDVPNLDEVLVIHTYDELHEMFYELGDEPDADVDPGDDYDDTPVRGKKSVRDDEDDEKPSRRKRDDTEDDDDEKPRKKPVSRDDEDDDEKPSRRKKEEDDEDPEPKRGKKKPVEDDDDDTPKRGKKKEEDDDDDETGKCPKKHKFGVDTDKFDDCDECPIKIWTKCDEKKRASKR